MYDPLSLCEMRERLLPASGRLLKNRRLPAKALWHLLIPFVLLLAAQTVVTAADRQQNIALVETAVPAVTEQIVAGSGLLVALTHADTPAGTAAWLRANDLIPVKIWPELNMALVTDGAGDAVQPAAADRLAHFRLRTEALAGIRFAAYDLTIYAADRLGESRVQEDPHWRGSVADPLVGEQWSLAAMGVADAWAITSGHSSVPIAIIDSGLEIDHEDLQGVDYWTNAAEANGLAGVDDDDNGYVDDIAGWDWIDRDSRPQDLYGHGTHVTGIISAAANNGLGIAGVAPKSAILPLRVLDATGVGRLSDLIDAMVYARARGVHILNLSLVLPIDSPALAEAVAQLHAPDLIIFAATGNGAEHVYWPAAYPETVAVGAVDRFGAHAAFSNVGREVDLAAPGVHILGTYLDNSYALFSGTSMATANVSGLAALVWSLRPDLTRDDLLALLQETAIHTDDAGLVLESALTGAGRINFPGALHRASAALTLAPSRAAERTIFTGEPGQMQIRVTPSTGNQGAAGAHVRYELLIDPASASTATSLVTGTVVTDLDGAATIRFATPEKPTDCVLRVAVGAATDEIALAVRSRPADLQLLLDQTMIPADADAALLRIELRDAGGAWLVGDFPVELSATRGAFANGASTIEVTTRDGRAALNFVPGRASGLAVVRAQLGDLHSERSITVIPAAPAQMEIDVEFMDPASIAQESPEAESGDSDPNAFADLTVTLHLRDEFDNPVKDDTIVRLLVQGGEPEAEWMTTRNGTAAAGVRRASAAAAVEITALVPDTGLQRMHTVPPTEFHVLLPHVIAR